MYRIQRFTVNLKDSHKTISFRGLDGNFAIGVEARGDEYDVYRYDMRNGCLSESEDKVDSRGQLILEVTKAEIIDQLQREWNDSYQSLRNEMESTPNLGRKMWLKAQINRRRGYYESKLREKISNPGSKEVPRGETHWSPVIRILVTEACSASEIIQRLKAEGFSTTCKFVRLHGRGWQILDNDREITVETFLKGHLRKA